LFNLVLPPLLEYGIGLEAHGQNMVARICLRTGAIKGFAVRDFGGIRLHVPTLEQHGVKLDPVPSGSATLTHSLHEVWSKVHHSMLQNHVGFLLSSLGLENDGGWSIVREELWAVLQPDRSSLGQRLYDFFLADTMPFKCFLRMRMEGKHRDVSDTYLARNLR
jgi:siderophore synthetase component